MDLWKLSDYITFVNLELEIWNLVQYLLISFCLGSEILVQFGQPQPPKNTPKPPKHFEYELYDYIFFLLSRTGFAKSLREAPVKRRRENKFGKQLIIHTHTYTHMLHFVFNFLFITISDFSFVPDGINSVGDYNSSLVGVVCLFVCLCVPTFFSCFTIG